SSSTDFPTAGSPPYRATPLPGTTGGNLSEEDAFIAKISPAATTTIMSGTNPSTGGQNVSFTITVTVGGSPATDGMVVFYDSLCVACKAAEIDLTPADNGQVVFTYAPSVGVHTITAEYVSVQSDLPSLASLTQTVVGGGTVATALSAPLVVVPTTGSSGPQPIGDIRLAETVGGSLQTTGRIVI